MRGTWESSAWEEFPVEIVEDAGYKDDTRDLRIIVVHAVASTTKWKL